MGSLLCCFSIVDAEGSELEQSDDPIFRCCFCLRCLTQQLTSAYISLFHRLVVLASSPAHTVMDALIPDCSIPDTYRFSPRPLAYDDPRCSRLWERHGSKRDKCTCHSGESDSCRRSYDEIEVEAVKSADDPDVPRGVNFYESSSIKQTSLDAMSGSDIKSGSTYYFSSSDEEEVCPTCLEEYTSTDPKTTLQCSHHFHLACIYEWMERSEACPVCGKVMLIEGTR